MTRKKPYSRKLAKQRIGGLMETLQEGVAAGDLPQIAVSHVIYTLSNFESRLAEREAHKTPRRTPAQPPRELTEPIFWLQDTDATQRECVAMIPYLEDIESSYSVIGLAHAWANGNSPGCHALEIYRDPHTRYIVHKNADDPENIHTVKAKARTVYIKKEGK